MVLVTNLLSQAGITHYSNLQTVQHSTKLTVPSEKKNNFMQYIHNISPGSAITKANTVKQNNQHQDKGRKSVFFCGLSVVSRQSYDSFIFKYCVTVSLVVVSLIPRSYLFLSGYETNLLMWI